jgi:hypothetical protein
MKDRTDRPFAGALVATWGAMLVVAAPLAAVMLTPQLMRSRVEAAPGLSWLGISLFLALSAASVAIAPAVSARVAPAPPAWLPGNARAATRALRRQAPGLWWRRAGEFAAVFVCSQVAGGYVAWLMPHIWRAPATADRRDPGWVLDYPNYATQAVVMYGIICLGSAWYATRVRQLVLDRPYRHEASAGPAPSYRSERAGVVVTVEAARVVLTGPDATGGLTADAADDLADALRAAAAHTRQAVADR